MMDSQNRELGGLQAWPEWKSGGRQGHKEKLELTKMDTLIMQVSKISRSVAEVRESCLCLEESISTEEKRQAELESVLKLSSVTSSGGHQHSVTEANLQVSTQLIRGHVEGDDRKNEIIEEELVSLVQKLANIEESKKRQLKEMKDHYGNQLVDKEDNEQQKRTVELKHKKNVLTICLLNLKQENHRRTHEKWSSFTAVVINLAKLQYTIRNSCKTMQQHKSSVEMLQTAVHSRKQAESPPIILRGLREESKKNCSTSSSPDITQNDILTPKTSSSTYVPAVQGQDHPQAKYSFSTSLSLLKLPSTKFGDKKTNDCYWSTPKGGGETVDSSAVESSQIITSLRCNQDQPLETSYCPFNNHLQIPASSGPKISPLGYQHNQNNNKHHKWKPAPGDSDVSTNSFSCDIFPQTKTQLFEASRAKDIDCPLFFSKATREPSSSHETLSISSPVYRGLEMVPHKLKSLKITQEKHKISEVTISKGFQSSHNKLRGAGTPYLLSKCKHALPSSRGTDISSSRCFSVYSQVPYKKSCKRYSNSPQVNTEAHGFSLSSKQATHKEKSQDFVVSTSLPEENPTEPSENDDNETPSNTVQSSQNETVPIILPSHMEVDNHESPKVTHPLSSLKKTLSEACQTMYMEPSTSKDTPHTSGDSVGSSNITISITDSKKASRQAPSCIPAVSTPISHPTSQSLSICKEREKSEYPNMMSLQYKQNLLAPSENLDHPSEGLSNSNLGTETGFPFMFQNDADGNSERNLQFSLFGSPLTEPTVQESSKNSESNFLALENCDNSRRDSTTSSLFNFNFGSAGEATENSNSSFFSSLFESSSGTNSSSHDTPDFHLF